MKLLFVHAHFDDFEFTAAGVFLLWNGRNVRKRILICTDGAAGHHILSREETFQRRLQEQKQSAKIGGYELELLRLPDGRIPREACWSSEPLFLPALWKAIRDYEPDYLFCPPLPDSPLAGVHIDHLAVAQAIRNVAYLINVPHVFSPEYPEESGPARFRKTPVIFTVQDVYSDPDDGLELIVDISNVFDKVVEMSWCHQSQICEWLPWVGRHGIKTPLNINQWYKQMEVRYSIRAHKLGLPETMKVEAFSLTSWGRVPQFDELCENFPNLIMIPERIQRLKRKIERWLQREG